MAGKHTPVVFLDSRGNEISNDPVWKAQKTLQQRGVEEQPSADNSDLERQIADLRAQLAAKEAEELAEDDDDNEPQPDVDENGARTYKELTSKALAGFAKDRGIELTKGMKAGEVRAALIAQDTATAK